jgi:hypothetical protein
MRYLPSLQWCGQQSARQYRYTGARRICSYVKYQEAHKRGRMTMRYVNDYDIDIMLRRWERGSVQWRAADIIRRLRDETNRCSDGWAYWNAPLSAAQQMIAIAQGCEFEPKHWARAVAAIRRFYTIKGNAAGMRKIV